MARQLTGPQAVSAQGRPGEPAGSRFQYAVPDEELDLIGKLWRYQQERFPVVRHGVLIGVFSLGAMCHASLLRDCHEMPALASASVCFATVFLFFLIMRIADEFKDYEDDARYRPYRAVPRGLVSLEQLRIVAVVAVTLQMLLTLALDRELVGVLVLAWAYLALMTREFFLGAWLKARPMTYLATHMLIMPLIVLYAMACDWMPADTVHRPSSISWFLLLSLVCGIVLELGRKIRAPQEEEEGVQTYSSLWGPTRALQAWIISILAGSGLAVAAARQVDFTLPAAAASVILLAAAVGLARRCVLNPCGRNYRRIEDLSGYWVLIVYLGLGIIPLMLRTWGV